MHALISGIGIAGPTLAFWLQRQGWEITLVEKADHLRRNGYVIDFWGAGFDIAERMGVLPQLRDVGYAVKRVSVVNDTGQEVTGFRADAFSSMTQGRYLSLPRGELAAAIYRSIESHVEARFADAVQCLAEDDQGVQVTFDSGLQRRFDMVIGADGLHSRIRELAFGPEKKFEHYLGYKVAVFEARAYRPRNELVYVMHTQVGQQVARFALRDEKTMFLFTFADDDPALPADIAEQKALLHRRFGDAGWECGSILDALDATNELYFDRVSQIRMPAENGLWTRGRIVLLGDAACAVSLLAGQGSALAMVAAYVLAGELHRARNNYAAAFASYQDRLRPFIARKQKAALRFAGTFAPKSNLSIWVRNWAMKLFNVPWVADWVMGRDLSDRIALPNY